METKEWRFIDKSGWDRGEWDDEPDKMQWQDEATGLACLIHRGPSGSLCGYVGVPPGHPLYGADYNNVDVSVHGGLTFADKCQGEAENGRGICHVPGPGEPDSVWWFGFDCAHALDYSPAYSVRYRGNPIVARRAYETYRTLAYVREQVTHLAAQIARSPAVSPRTN